MRDLSNNFELKISNQNIDYIEAIKFMQKRVEEVLNNNSKELLWFLNHDHIYTCGTSANKKEILSITDIPIINTNRGGKTTYHGPGQRLMYLIVDLNKRNKDIRKFINLIENSIIEILDDLNIEATSFHNKVGIWVTKVNGITLQKEKKIGAIGLRIKKWITYHGLSFNLDPNLKYYDNIIACGLEDYSATSLKELGIKMSVQEFDNLFINIFFKKLKSF